MREEIRKTGIDVIGSTPWSTHFCQFYETKEDLIDILVPYFRAGLEDSEFCMWITAEPLNTEEARQAITESMPDFNQYLTRGQIEILPYTEWYLKGGIFNLQQVLDGWIDKLNRALTRGYEGIRISGNTAWLERRDWKDFKEYEATINNVIGKHKMLALCTYCLGKCGASDIVEVINTHEFALIKREGRWDIIENAAYKQTKEALVKAKAELEIQVKKRTEQLEGVIKRLRREITDHKQAEKELKCSHQYLEKLNNSLEEVIFTVKIPDRVINYVNSPVKNVFGYEVEECLGKSTEFLYPNINEYQSFGDKLNNAIKEERESLHTEHLMGRKSGEVFPVEITTTFLRENGEIKQVISILRDITKRKQREEILRLSEARLAEAQRIAHLGNWDWNIVENRLLWSDEIYRIFGLTPQQFGATYEAFLNSVHPEDREFVEQSVNEALYEGKPYSIDHRITLPDGTMRFVHEEAEVTFNKNNQPIRMLGTVHDITERKRAEDELRALSNQLVHSQEEERQNIASELHDQIGQSLTMLKLLLDDAVKSPAKKLYARVDEARAQINELIGQVRDLSLDLRPAMLDNLGLLPTLIWHFDQYNAKTQLRVNFKHRGLRGKLPAEMNVAVYRIVQEALTNIVRHAGVNEANVYAWVDQELLQLRIEDKGRGFDPNTLPVGTSSGLYGMRERALSLGGKLTIESTPGAGTIVIAELPL